MYHKIVVDSETREAFCICGEPKCDGEGKKRAKFHNRSSEYNGYIYDSELEMRQAVELDWRLRAKDIKSWERQVKISFFVCPGCSRVHASVCSEHPKEKQMHLWNYYCDFVVYHNDGDKEFLETKGLSLTPWKRSWALMEAIYGSMPGIRLTVVKQSASRNWKGRI